MDDKVRITKSNIFISLATIAIVLIGLQSEFVSSISFQQVDILLVSSSLLFVVTMILSFITLLLDPTDDIKFFSQMKDLSLLFNFTFIISSLSLFVVVSENQVSSGQLLFGSGVLGGVPVYFWSFFVIFSFLCTSALSKQYSEKGYDGFLEFAKQTVLNQEVFISSILLYSITIVSSALITGKLGGLYVLIYIIVLMLAILVLKNYRGNKYEFN